nr:double-stranded break repair protein [Tranzscheliella williamsii]
MTRPKRSTASQRQAHEEPHHEEVHDVQQEDHTDEQRQVGGPGEGAEQAEAEVDELEQPPSTFSAQNEANHIKIMLATDNHVGYMERDPVRGQDSIRTLEEILQLAVQHEVDLILLGGDLFHDNKPSRSTLHQTMALLRQYTFGDKPISVELLSDPDDGAVPGRDFPSVNYEDPNLNVSIPVFSIHGNHDDPQGAGETGALSALDLLSVSGLINYFGKIELPSDDATAAAASTRTANGGAFQEKGIRIKPVLLQKGETRLALYGMGNIKDERMHFELRANRVRMYRPEEDPDSWFNILCVHQNRVAHNPKACVPETMFDDSVHLVVWGHEHEQMIQPQPVTEKRYHITQPGSSIATSLSRGETVEKCVAIIHVEHTDFLIEPIPLQTVRPFVMDDMVLADELEEAGLSSDRADIMKLLRKRVSGLVEKANSEYKQRYPDREATLPLVRLRVEYTTQEISNPQRFGQEFAGKVANPKDVLQFSKKKSIRGSNKDATGGGSAFVDLSQDDLMPIERIEKVDVGKLVQEYLQAQNLDILNADGLEGAVLNFVEKDDKDAIDSFVSKMLRNTVKGLVTIDPEESGIDGELERLRQEQSKRHNQMEIDGAPTGHRGASSARAGSSRRGHESDDSMVDELASGGQVESDVFDADEDLGPSARTRTPSRRKTHRPRNDVGASTSDRALGSSQPTASRSTQRNAGSRAQPTFLGQDSLDEDNYNNHQDGSDVDVDESTSTPAPPSTTGRHAAALGVLNKPTPPTSSRTKKAPAAAGKSGRGGRASAARSSRQQQESIQISDDDDIANVGAGAGAADDDDDFVEPTTRSLRSTRTTRASRR